MHFPCSSSYAQAKFLSRMYENHRDTERGQVVAAGPRAWDSVRDAVVASLSFRFASFVLDWVPEKLKTEMPMGTEGKSLQETLLFQPKDHKRSSPARQETGR